MYRILLADDDDELCELLTDYLRGEGFAVEAVHDGEAAVAAARDGDYDLAVLDVMMPLMSGFDALREIRPEVAAVVCTGNDPRPPTDRAPDVPVLHKPFRAADLERVLEALFADQTGETRGARDVRPLADVYEEEVRTQDERLEA